MTKCIACGCGLTWEAQRRQFGRMMRHGLSPDAAKPLTPRCQKCTTTLLRDIAKGEPTARAAVPAEPPIIACHVEGDTWRFYCRHCREWHQHGHGPGRRVAHCTNPRSPYRTGGYYIERAA